MKSLGWALIKYGWCPYKKRRFGHRHTQRDDHLKTQGEDSHLQDKKWGLWRNQLCWHFGLALPAFRTVRNKFLLFKPSSLWYFAMAALENWDSEATLYSHTAQGWKKSLGDISAPRALVPWYFSWIIRSVPFWVYFCHINHHHHHHHHHQQQQQQCHNFIKQLQNLSASTNLPGNVLWTFRPHYRNMIHIIGTSHSL